MTALIVISRLPTSPLVPNSSSPPAKRRLTSTEAATIAESTKWFEQLGDLGEDEDDDDDEATTAAGNHDEQLDDLGEDEDEGEDGDGDEAAAATAVEDDQEDDDDDYNGMFDT